MQGWCSTMKSAEPGDHGMENEASFDCDKTIKDPESADWYVCGGSPELHGADYRKCPQPTSGMKGNEDNSN